MIDLITYAQNNLYSKGYVYLHAFVFIYMYMYMYVCMYMLYSVIIANYQLLLFCMYIHVHCVYQFPL